MTTVKLTGRKKNTDNSKSDAGADSASVTSGSQLSDLSPEVKALFAQAKKLKQSKLLGIYFANPTESNLI
jgi:hypothetical protein